MFEKEIDEIYGLCKRVIKEVPTAHVVFDLSIYSLGVYGFKNKDDLGKSECKWDFFETFSHSSLEEEKRESYEKMKAFLLKLLAERKCANE